MFLRLTLLPLTVKICQFSRLAANFLAVLRLTVNLIKTLYQTLLLPIFN